MKLDPLMQIMSGQVSRFCVPKYTSQKKLIEPTTLTYLSLSQRNTGTRDHIKSDRVCHFSQLLEASQPAIYLQVLTRRIKFLWLTEALCQSLFTASTVLRTFILSQVGHV